MINTFKLLLFIILGSVNSFSQNFETTENLSDYCSEDSNPKNRENVLKLIESIADYAGVGRNFSIIECPDINNAFAKNIKNNVDLLEKYILYDLEFFNQINALAGTSWAATSILAHEVGHHINGHSLNNIGSTYKFELEADKFSGRILGFMGATLEEAQAAMNTKKSEEASSTHPAKRDRLAQIKLGWENAKGMSTVVDEEEVKRKLAQSFFDKALKAIDSAEYEVALSYLNTLTYEGLSEAYYFLSKLYHEGLGVSIDQKKAYDLAVEGHNKGSVSCTYLLGYYLYSGKGVKTNREAAINLWNKDFILQYFENQLEKTNNPFYADELGMIYFSGIAVIQDRKKANLYFKEAADNNNVLAMYHLGGWYMDNNNPSFSEAEARIWFEKAAEKEFSAALTTLGNFHCKEIECSGEDRKTAELLYEKALEKQYPEAGALLGILYYYDGQLDKSNFYFRKVEDSHPYAKMSLGNIILRKENLTKEDVKNALTYLFDALDENYYDTYISLIRHTDAIYNGSIPMPDYFETSIHPYFSGDLYKYEDSDDYYNIYRTLLDAYPSLSSKYTENWFRTTPDFVNQINAQLYGS